MDSTTNGNTSSDIEIDAPPDHIVAPGGPFTIAKPAAAPTLEQRLDEILMAVLAIAGRLEQLDALLEHYRPLLERADARMRRASMFSRGAAP